MELVLEHDEVDRLLRQALAAEGIMVDPSARFFLRAN